jgi:hypothetical protein
MNLALILLLLLLLLLYKNGVSLDVLCKQASKEFVRMWS